MTLKSLLNWTGNRLLLTPLTKYLTALALVINRAPPHPPRGTVKKAIGFVGLSQQMTKAWVSPGGLHLISHLKSSQDSWSCSRELVHTPLCSRIGPKDARVRAVTLPPSLIGLLLQGTAGDQLVSAQTHLRGRRGYTT